MVSDYEQKKLTYKYKVKFSSSELSYYIIKILYPHRSV